MSNPIKRSEVIEDGVFAPTIQEANQLYQALIQLKAGFSDVLNATKQQAQSNAFKDFSDVENAAKAMNNAKAAAEGMAQAEKDLAKVTEAVVRNIEAEEKVLKDVKGSYEANIQQITQLKLQSQALAKEKKALQKEYEKGKISLDTLAAKTAKLAEEEVQLKTATSQLNQTINTQTKEMVAADSSMDSISQRLGQLKSAYRALSKEERENAEVGGVLLASINELDTEIKELDASIGNHQRNVGNYSSAWKDAAMEIGPVGKIIRDVEQAKVTLTKITIASKNAILAQSSAWKILRTAIISTGIGALVLGLSSLVAFLTRTQEGLDWVSRKMAGFRVVIGVVVDKLSDFGEVIFNAFSNPKQALMDLIQALGTNLLNRLKAFVIIFEGIKSGNIDKIRDGFIQANTGIEGGTERLKKFKDELNQARIAAEGIQKEFQRIRDEERKITLERARAKKDVETLKLIAEDTTKTTIERIEATRKAFEIEQKSIDNQLKLQREKIANIEREQALTKNLTEDNDKLNEEKIKLAELEEGSLTRQIELNNKINAIRLEAMRKRIEMEEKYQELLIENMSEGFEKMIAEENLAYQKRKRALEGNYKALEQLEILHQNNLAKIIRERNEVPKAIERQGQTVLGVQKTLKNQEINLVKQTNDNLKNAEKTRQVTANENLNKLKDQGNKTVQIAEATDKRLTEISNRRLTQLDRELQASQTRADELRALAIQGDKDAAASIVAEEKRQAEIERKKEKEAQKAKRRELGLTAINTYNSKIQAGDKNALGSTIRDLTLLGAAISTIPGFYEGTENVAASLGKPHLPGKDGYIVRVDGNERVFNGADNARIGDMSNETLTNIAVAFNKGLLVPISRAAFVANSTDFSALEAKLSAIERNTAKAERLSFQWDDLNKALTEIARKEYNRKETKHKVGGLF